MKIITLDFETYYSKSFSLSKITTEEYIRSPEFEVIGVSVKVDDEPAMWFSGTKEQTKRFLDRYDWDNAAAVAHNAMFDMAILSWVFDIRPKRIADTMSMAKAIHGPDEGASLSALVKRYKLGVKGDEVISALGMRRLDFDEVGLRRYAAYCKNDTELTYKLFRVLVAGFPVSELRLIDLTIRMFSEPVLKLDYAGLMSHLDIVRGYKNALMAKIDADKEDLMSNQKFAELLVAHGVEPPMKISPTTGKDTYAFGKNDEEFKELAEHENLGVQALVAARLGVKSTIEETRTQRFIDVHKRGTLPIPLRYYAAHTGRWGGSDKINMQNLPRNSNLKGYIRAPEGYMMIDSDSSQIEARTLAWLAEQNDLVDAFDKGEDVYKIMASKIYNKNEKNVTKDERFVGKTTILGAGYGMGAAKFRKQLKTFGVDISEDEARGIIDTYRSAYPAIPKLWREAGDALKAIINDQTVEIGRNGVLVVEGTNGIRLPNGLYIQYPNLRQRNNEGKMEYVYDTKRGKTVIPNRIYGGKVVENVCQALARIIIGEQMLMIAKKYKVVMTVHDAIACIVPENQVAVAQENIEMLMKVRPAWALELPLSCEAGSGKTYGDC
jgi:DNA polymerase I-like protein with 3'-5' exonuclease and polymerase domains